MSFMKTVQCYPFFRLKIYCHRPLLNINSRIFQRRKFARLILLETVYLILDIVMFHVLVMIVHLDVHLLIVCGLITLIGAVSPLKWQGNAMLVIYPTNLIKCTESSI
jgi:hypothetical protein